MSVALYVRVSTQRQAQSQTIEQQLERLQHYCQTQGWSISSENIFRDDGYSGAKLSRPGLDRLRDQLRLARFDRLVITAPDRLARNYVHQMLLIEEIENQGCQLEFLDRPMSQDPHDQLLLQIRGAVAEYERSLIVERMRRGRMQKYQAGVLLPWTRPPYGYRLDPQRPRDPSGVRVEESEAAVINLMFSYYLEENRTLCGLAEHLIQLEILSPSGQRRWNQASVRGILTNPAYTGTVYAGRTRSRPAFMRQSPLKPVGTRDCARKPTTSQEWLAVCQIPALITKEQFELVQNKLSYNQQFARRNNKSHQYLLRALVSCGICHLACIARTTDNYSYYACRGKGPRVQSCRDEKCRSRLIPARQLEEMVWNDLCEVIQQPGLIKQALERAQGGEWLPQDLQARRESLRRATVSLEQQLERLTQAYLAGVVQLEEYKRRRLELEQRQQSLNNQLGQLQASVNQQMELDKMVSSIEDFCKKIEQGLGQASFEEKRQLVELVIDRVIVSNEEVEIRYVIPTSPRSEAVRFCHLRKDYFLMTSVL